MCVCICVRVYVYILRMYEPLFSKDFGIHQHFVHTIVVDNAITEKTLMGCTTAYRGLTYLGFCAFVNTSGI